MYNLQYLSKKALKIALLSLADIDNYGDSFFPYLFRAELYKRMPGAQIDLFTNIPFDCGLYQTNAFSKDILEGYDAVILAGGDTIQRLDEEEWKPIYKRLSDNAYTGRPSDIAFGWLSLNKPFKCWFSVGVHPNILGYSNDVAFALSRLDYLTVRGVISKKLIENNFIDNNVNINIVPDLGWLFPEYIDGARLNLKGIFQKSGVPEVYGSPYATFETFTDPNLPVKMIAQTLTEFQSKSNIRVLLIPFIRPWNDYEILSQIREASNNELLLMPNSLNFLETGAVLRGSEFFIGSSMHGAVTCLAYGEPAANILSPWTAPKLQDLHGMRDREDCFVNDWEKLCPLLNMLKDEKNRGIAEREAYSRYKRLRLTREIDTLCEKIIRHVEGRQHETL